MTTNRPSFPIVTFKPLSTSHFQAMAIWLNTPHVSQWYGEGTAWDLQNTHKKYRTYVDGYALVDNTKRPIRGFIITIDDTPIGYIQYYYAYDFPRIPELSTTELPLDLAAIDFFIGQVDYVGKGLGPAIVTQFLDEQVWNKFDACFVDPDTKNNRAIRACEKAGFKTLNKTNKGVTTWMIALKDPLYTPSTQCKPLCCCSG